MKISQLSIFSISLNSIGYHEVPDKAKSRFSPAFQIEDRSKDSIVIPPNLSDGEGRGNATNPRADDSILMKYLGADVKFTITVALSLITILAVVYYFPKVVFNFFCKKNVVSFSWLAQCQ